MFTATAVAVATTNQIVEHIVLFKVKPDAPNSKISAMVNGLSSLVSLPQVLSLTVGPIHRFHSSLTFTHLLYTRFRSKHDLHSYSAHPAHLAVVEETKPIIDDIMAIDWLAEHQPPPAPGSAIRIGLYKVKEAGRVLDLIGETRGRFPGISFGNNFSPGRSKGFSVCSILKFPSVGEMESSDLNEGLVKEEAGEVIHDVAVIDYVIPVAPGATVAGN